MGATSSCPSGYAQTSQAVSKGGKIDISRFVSDDYINKMHEKNPLKQGINHEMKLKRQCKHFGPPPESEAQLVVPPALVASRLFHHIQLLCNGSDGEFESVDVKRVLLLERIRQIMDSDRAAWLQARALTNVPQAARAFQDFQSTQLTLERQAYAKALQKIPVNERLAVKLTEVILKDPASASHHLETLLDLLVELAPAMVPEHAEQGKK